MTHLGFAKIVGVTEAWDDTVVESSITEAFDRLASTREGCRFVREISRHTEIRDADSGLPALVVLAEFEIAP
jgi:hypothetical protein